MLGILNLFILLVENRLANLKNWTRPIVSKISLWKNLLSYTWEQKFTISWSYGIHFYVLNGVLKIYYSAIFFHIRKLKLWFGSRTTGIPEAKLAFFKQVFTDVKNLLIFILFKKWD